MSRRYDDDDDVPETGFDAKTQTLTYELEDEDGNCVFHTFPAKFEVCGYCEGRGKHVNPAVDGHGISQEEFDEDPGFCEDYFAGVYDVTCEECHGRNVVPIVDETNLSAEQKQALKEVEKQLEADARYEAEERYSRRMGY